MVCSSVLCLGVHPSPQKGLFSRSSPLHVLLWEVWGRPKNGQVPSGHCCWSGGWLRESPSGPFPYPQSPPILFCRVRACVPIQGLQNGDAHTCATWRLSERPTGTIILWESTFPDGTMINNPATNAEDERNEGSIPELGSLLGEELATRSSIFAWRIPWTEEPGRLQTTGSHRVRHKWSNLAHTTCNFPKCSLTAGELPHGPWLPSCPSSALL